MLLTILVTRYLNLSRSFRTATGKYVSKSQLNLKKVLQTASTLDSKLQEVETHTTHVARNYKSTKKDKLK